MRIHLAAFTLLPLFTACGVKTEVHEAVVAQLAEANQKLEAANKALADATAKTTAAETKADGWKKAATALAGLAAIEVEIGGLAHGGPVDCVKLGTALDEHLAKKLRAPLAQSLTEAETAVGKADLDAAAATWTAAVTSLDASFTGFSEALTKACAKDAEALTTKISTARKGAAPAAAPAPTTTPKTPTTPKIPSANSFGLLIGSIALSGRMIKLTIATDAKTTLEARSR